MTREELTERLHQRFGPMGGFAMQWADAYAAALVLAERAAGDARVAKLTALLCSECASVARTDNGPARSGGET